MSEAVREYGDAVRVAIGPKTLYIFNHPDHAKHVLADNAPTTTRASATPRPSGRWATGC